MIIMKFNLVNIKISTDGNKFVVEIISLLIYSFISFAKAEMMD